MYSQFTQSWERGRENDDYVTYHLTDTRYRLLKQRGVPSVGTDMRRLLYVKNNQKGGYFFIQIWLKSLMWEFEAQ